MNDLTRWDGGSGLSGHATSLSKREFKAVARAIDRQLAQGLLSAAKVQAAGLVADTALTLVSSLSAKETYITEFTPASDPVQKANVQRRTAYIVDSFTQAAAAEIMKFGQ